MPECNKCELIIENFQPSPDWICSNYMERALQEKYNDKSIRIVNISIKPATAKGDNYASIISRVKVDYTCQGEDQIQNGSYLIKSSFESDEFATEKFSQYGVYEREMEIYGKIFPRLKDMLENVGIYEELVPDTIRIDYDHDSIMFEDLAVRSFVTPERHQGLDLVHAKMILRKLAILQAASAVLGHNEPEIFQSYDRGMFNRHTEAFSPCYLNNLKACAEVVSTWPGYEKCAQKLFALEGMLMEYGKRAFDRKNHHINVLVHGDLWMTNAMFKYNAEKKPIDVIIIDFQFSCWSSPTIDLHYFLNTSLTDELARNNQDELVQYYYETMANTLQSLSFKGKIPSLKEFWMEYMETSFYGFVSACLVQPIHINDQTEDADFAALMKEDERALKFKRTIYKNERVHRTLKRVLPIFDRRGLLEVHQ